MTSCLAEIVDVLVWVDPVDEGPPVVVHLRYCPRCHLWGQEETVPHRWQRGDVLVLDNLLAAHGRMPFSGARKIALAMI